MIEVIIDEDCLNNLPLFTFLPDTYSFKEYVLPLSSPIQLTKTPSIVQPFFELPTHKFTSTFTFYTHSNLKKFLEFIHQTKGNIEKFWLPVWINQFQLSRPAFATESVISVKNVKLFHLLPETLKSKLRIFFYKPLSSKKVLFVIRQVMNIIEVSNEEEQLFLSSKLNYDFKTTTDPSNPDNILIGRLALVRFATENFNLKFFFSTNQEFKNQMIAKIDLEFLELTYEFVKFY